MFAVQILLLWTMTAGADIQYMRTLYDHMMRQVLTFDCACVSVFI